MKDIFRVLDELGIAYRKTEHAPVFTVQEGQQAYGWLEGCHTKNLFLRNKKGDRHYLVVAECHSQVDLRRLRRVLGESALSFASPERLERLLGQSPGSVSPFGLIHDSQRQVTVIVDRRVWSSAALNAHPNVNTATLTLTMPDFIRFLDHCGHEVRVVEIEP